MLDNLSPLIKQFLPFAQERMGFDYPPRLFLRGDSQNAKNPLGKTAYYDPGAKSITIYVTDRHPKDVMRSLSHELVHHTQNCQGKFSDVGEMGEGYAQNDTNLREMEREAYEVGNMCFRDWEDSIKSTIYFEHLQKGEKSNMSIKDWKNNELTTLLSEAWGFKFNNLQEFDEFNGTGEVQEEELEEAQEEDLEEVAGVSPPQAGRREPHKRTPVPDAEEEEEEEEALEESPAHPAADREGNRATGRRVKKNSQRVEEDAATPTKAKYTESQIREALKKAIKLVKEQKTNGQEK